MEKIYYSYFYSPLLEKTFVASTEKGVLAVDFFTTEKVFLKGLKKRFSGTIIRDNQKNKKVLSQIKKYLKGELKRFDCRLDLRGTPFQKKVWSALTKIPYGQTRSYQDIARSIGHPKAFRAVGNANRKNCIPLMIPCHRVIANDNTLGGFGYGIGVKRRLLGLEKNLKN